MRQSIANVWVVGLVITFILIFCAFIIITINYNKVFKEKNTLVTIIEKNNGMTNKGATCGGKSAIPGADGSVCVGAGALQTINAYLLGMNYSGTGNCPIGEDGEKWHGVSDLMSGLSPNGGVSTDEIDGAKAKQKYAYCFAKFDVNGAVYYKVKLFFYIDLPVIGSFIPIEVDGTTASMRNVIDDF